MDSFGTTLTFALEKKNTVLYVGLKHLTRDIRSLVCLKHLTRDIHTLNFLGYQAVNSSFFFACNKEQFMDVAGVEIIQCQFVGLPAVFFPFVL